MTESEHVVQRHEADPDILRNGPFMVANHMGAVDQILVGEHRSLGHTRGAAGIEERGHIIPSAFRTQRDLDVRLVALEDRPQFRVPLNHDDVPDMGDDVPVRDMGKQFFTGDDHGGEGIIDQAGHLIPLVCCGNANGDRAEPGDRVVKHGPLGDVRKVEADPLIPCHPKVSQVEGDMVNDRIEFCRRCNSCSRR